MDVAGTASSNSIRRTTADGHRGTPVPDLAEVGHVVVGEGQPRGSARTLNNGGGGAGVQWQAIGSHLLSADFGAFSTPSQPPPPPRGPLIPPPPHSCPSTPGGRWGALGGSGRKGLTYDWGIHMANPHSPRNSPPPPRGCMLLSQAMVLALRVEDKDRFDSRTYLGLPTFISAYVYVFALVGTNKYLF